MGMSINSLKSKREDLTFKIKSKKEFSNLDKEFISNIINSCFSYNEIIKILHDIYGVFNISFKERKILLNKLEKEVKNKNEIDEKILKIHKNILSTHRSTKERLNDYERIYDKIFNKFKANSILDLGAGINPISYPWMKFKNVDYIAVELTKKDCEFMQKYFNIMKKFGLNGKCLKMDLLNIKELPEVDVCFIWKVLDSLETLKRNVSKEILSKINAKIIVVSFPTKTLRGKKLSKKRLVWFKKLIRNYEIFETKNEIFYIIKKNKNF